MRTLTLLFSLPRRLTETKIPQAEAEAEAEAVVKMEIQRKNPSLKVRARKEKMSLDDYMDFLLSHEQLHPTVNFLNQVHISLFLEISFHFWSFSDENSKYSSPNGYVCVAFEFWN